MGAAETQWWQVVAETDTASSELVSDRFHVHGSAGVEEQTTGSRTRLIAGFASESAARAAAEAVSMIADTTSVRPVVDDGLDAWREHAEIIQTRHFTLIPAWIDPPRADDEDQDGSDDARPNHRRPAKRIALRLDPGRTFGSGSHPTTRLCLDTLAELEPAGLRVLDVGTGSGILAVAAAKLGATDVTAIDTDPASPATAAENASRNGVAHLIRASNRTPADVIAESGPFDIVLANLLAPTLIELAEDLRAAIGGLGGGALVVSGLLTDRHTPALDAIGLEQVAVEELDDWLAITLRAPGP